MDTYIVELDHRLNDVMEKIYSIFRESYKIEAELLKIEDFPPLNRDPDDIGGSPNRFWGLFLKEEMVAVIEIAADPNKEINIDSLVVKPGHMRKGYAQRLIDYILSRNDWSSITVETAEKNIPAINLYRKSGFDLVKSWNTEENIQINQFRHSGGRT